MGKQRRATKAKGENRNDINTQLDTILSILDLCGFYDDRTSPRMKLIDSLEALRVQYSRHVWWDESLQITETISQQILQLEDLIARVRDLIAHYEAKLEADFVEFTELQNYAVPASWKYVFDSLFSSYKTQHTIEVATVRNLTSALDRIYARSDPKDKSLDQFLESTIHCLHRYSLLHRVDFQEVVSVCSQSSAGIQLSHSEKEPLSTENKFRSEVGFSQVSQAVTSADNVLDAVRCFLSEASQVSTNASFFTTLLVIGSEGSGKTHLCDEVSILGQEASCQGKLQMWFVDHVFCNDVQLTT